MDEDISLVERYASGDEGAVEEIVTRYQRQIYGFFYRMTNNVEDAKDLTQKTFINVFNGIGDFKRKAAFKTWLYRIALNAGLNHIRKERPEQTEVDESIPCKVEGGLSTMIEKERDELVRRSLEVLPDRQRLAVVLRVYDGLSCAETAEVMQCTVGAVKAHYHNGIRRLREIIKENGYETSP